MIVLICKRVQFWIVALATITSIAPTSSTLIPMRKVGSRVSKHNFAGRPFYIKRDDENCIKGIQDSVSGNKSRKLLYLSSRMPFPKIIASYGGSQSNSMLAIAKVTAASSENSSFFYFLKPLPKFLRNAPTGNLKAALDLGMQVRADYYEHFGSMVALVCYLHYMSVSAIGRSCDSINLQLLSVLKSCWHLPCHINHFFCL